jgi:hypothetical protein
MIASRHGFSACRPSGFPDCPLTNAIASNPNHLRHLALLSTFTALFLRHFDLHRLKSDYIFLVLSGRHLATLASTR